MDWATRIEDWQTWLIVMFLLAGAEMLTMDLTLLMLAVGAGAGALAASLGVNVFFQVLIALVVSLSMLGLVRPNIVKRLHAGPTLKNNPEQLLEETGLVLERVTAYTGRVKLRGEVWSARSAEEGIVIEPGSRVGVARVDGATAIVFPTT